MTALEVYQRAVIDLDKYDTPTFEIVDFNRYAEKAIYEYINEKYLEFETLQKRTDDLRQFIVFNQYITNDLPYIDLPDDYLRMLKVEYRIDRGGCEVEQWFTAKKTTADKLGYSETNYYWRPSLRNPQYQIIGNRIYFRVGEGNHVYIREVRLEYIAVPVLYTIDEADMTVYSNPPYSDEVDMQIIDKIVRMFQSVTNPEQYQISVAETQFRKN